MQYCIEMSFLQPPAVIFFHLSAPTHLYIWLCLSVSWLVGPSRKCSTIHMAHLLAYLALFILTSQLSSCMSRPSIFKDFSDFLFPFSSLRKRLQKSLRGKVRVQCMKIFFLLCLFKTIFEIRLCKIKDFLAHYGLWVTTSLSHCVFLQIFFLNGNVLCSSAHLNCFIFPVFFKLFLLNWNNIKGQIKI